ncbi:MAG: metallophosphoesterase [Thermoguttaceae bacterium]
MATTAADRPIRILHLSDLHFTRSRGWEADRVLTGLAETVRGLVANGESPDVVAITGDIANDGKSSDYKEAGKWIDHHLKPALGDDFPDNHLLIVPGNHDVDRDAINLTCVDKQNELLTGANQQAVAALLCNPGKRRTLLNRHREYLRFANRYRSAADKRSVPWWSCRLTVRGTQVHFAGFCSSWMSVFRSKDDDKHLLLGQWQIEELLKDAAHAYWSLALVHHPFTYLADFEMHEVVTTIHHDCHLVLRGHEHQEEMHGNLYPAVGTSCLELAAGCCFYGKGYRNAFHLIELHAQHRTVRVHFWVWNGTEWIKDRNACPQTDDGTACFSLDVPETPATASIPSPPTIPPAYLDWLKSQCAGIDLLGLKVQQGQAVTLSHVYVPLTTPAEKTVETARSVNALLQDQPVQLLLDSLAKNNLYVAGAAGSGKSTFCRWVAWLACEGKMPETTPAAPEKYGERFPSSFAGRLPLLVRLRDFGTCLPETAGCCDMSQAELEDSLARWLDVRKPGGLTWEIVQPHLQNGSLLLILDGLDEVPLTHGDTTRPSQPRAMLVSALVASLRAWTEHGSRVILTSRPYGLDENHLRRMPLKPAPLSELDKPVRQLLVQRWFHCLVQSPEKAEATAQEMLQHVAQRADLGELTANPMLLTAMCIIYHAGGRLPQHRYDLYDRIIDNVLFHRFSEDREVIDPVRNRLAVVACGMHTGEGLGETRTTPQAEATYAEIDRMIQTYQDQRTWSEASYTSAVAAREQLLTRSGLFLPKGDNRELMMARDTVLSYWRRKEPPMLSRKS